MRVVFKLGVIGWDFAGKRRRRFGARGTPSEAELRAKHGPEHACHAKFLAYDCGQKRQLKSEEMGMSSRLEAYRVQAYNTSKQSENKIHDDAVARRFGFSGGLVPGVDGPSTGREMGPRVS
jgi:hypothetical protein